MAIYYLDVSIISRGKGQCATAAAAYRAGQRVHDERTGQTFDYTRRRSEIETEIQAPAGSPAWVQDRERLWNEAEKAERRGDAQLAREVKVALPLELDRDQARQLVHSYVQEQFVSRGMVADVAIHWEAKNPHAHIMLSMREMGPDGFAAKKNREWNTAQALEKWREQWAVESNRALERAGHQERIDHRSYVEQGLERLPQVHLGPDAAALERRGIATEKGDHNRLVAEHNAAVVDLEKARAEKEALQAQKATEEREYSLTRRGWSKEQVAALTDLEGTAGRPLTRDDLDAQQNHLREQLSGIHREMREIKDEEHRLWRASEALREYRGAQAEMQRLNSPIERVKRWFSPEAREQYRHAKYMAEWRGKNLEVWGAKTEADLKRQQTAFLPQHGRLSDLQAKEGQLTRAIKQVGKAVEGFSQEAMRRWEASRLKEWERMQERLRDRGMDRGR